jgi:hypothetical protein
MGFEPTVSFGGGLGGHAKNQYIQYVAWISALRKYAESAPLQIKDRASIRGAAPTPDATRSVQRGRDIPTAQALDQVWGYGIGIDLARRDLQAIAKKMSRPWDWA